MSDREPFENYFNDLLKYCKNLLRVHAYRSTISANLDAMSMATESISKNPKNKDEAIKEAKKFFFNEIERVKVAIQHRKNGLGGISHGYQKQCKLCKKVKTAQEFYKITRSRSGFTYLESKCKICYCKTLKRYPKKDATS